MAKALGGSRLDCCDMADVSFFFLLLICMDSFQSEFPVAERRLSSSSSIAGSGRVRTVLEASGCHRGPTPCSLHSASIARSNGTERRVRRSTCLCG